LPTHRHWRVSSLNEASLQDAWTPFNHGSGRDFHHRLLGFGVLLWLSVLPTTAFGAFLRATRFHQQNGTIEVIGSVLVAAATGALIGRSLRLRSWWLAAAALLPVALVVAMAGPIPVNNGRRPVLLLLGFLPIFVAAALLAALMTVEDRALADAPLRPG